MTDSKSGRLSRWLIIPAVILVSCAFPQSQAASSNKNWLKKSCRSLLLNSAELRSREVQDRFANFQFITLPDGSGFRFERMGQPDRRRVIQYNFDFAPTKLLATTDWYYRGRHYQFFQVGFKALENDALYLNSILAYHLVRNPDDHLMVRFPRERVMAELRLRLYRWIIHEAVLDRYFQSKTYLDPQKVQQLREPNVISGNSDVFGLIESPPDILELKAPEIERALLETLQISYFGDESYFLPSLEGALLHLGDESLHYQSRFPFEYRLRADQAAAFRRKLLQRFDPDSTCEFTRFMKFSKTLPRPVANRFLYEGMLAAQKRGMTAILASSDTRTSRFFRQAYAFKSFARLPTEQNAEIEYLQYIRTGSPEFRRTLKMLLATSREVEVGEELRR